LTPAVFKIRTHRNSARIECDACNLSNLHELFDDKAKDRTWPDSKA